MNVFLIISQYEHMKNNSMGFICFLLYLFYLFYSTYLFISLSTTNITYILHVCLCNWCAHVCLQSVFGFTFRTHIKTSTEVHTVESKICLKKTKLNSNQMCLSSMFFTHKGNLETSSYLPHIKHCAVAV